MTTYILRKPMLYWTPYKRRFWSKRLYVIKPASESSIRSKLRSLRSYKIRLGRLPQIIRRDIVMSSRKVFRYCKRTNYALS